MEDIRLLWWPRTIRWQLLIGLMMLEVLSLGLFAAILIRQQTQGIHSRVQQRLDHQANSMAVQAREALLRQQPSWVGMSVKMMGEDPSVALAKVTDPVGDVLFVSQGDPGLLRLDPAERAQISLVPSDHPQVFHYGNDQWEAVMPIYTGADLRGFAWVETNRDWEHEQLSFILGSTVLFGIVWLAASALLVLMMSKSISGPLATLHRGTRALMRQPEESSDFPLPVTVRNELGDLIEAFNRMVASIVEQRDGLNDTLSLLDSMLANAPIGLAFFDQRCRLVRVNQIFASMTGIALSRHLGRTLPELLPQPVAQQLEDAIVRVLADEAAVNNIEISGQSGKPQRPWTWLLSAYPVRASSRQVRWVGMIVLDASERKRAEDALRKTEKLAATGRLAASVAHEINNPLEAITNLLFLLRNFSTLDEPALKYVEMAEYEAQRIAEITQQTLRFYRQPTSPARANMAELLNAVIGLYQGRLNALGLHLTKEFDPSLDLFCFSGEIRQVFANLVGNALDASEPGGRLIVRARRSRNWSHTDQTGIRFTVADTGSGMDAEVRHRVFEAFFTTKEVTGTGLGLWVSQGIITKHNGLVHLRSRPQGQPEPSGTVFQLFLPDVEEVKTGQAHQEQAKIAL
jgi:PAS domain S-box-containing protein